MSKIEPVVIRRLQEAEVVAAFELIRQLRTQLDLNEFIARVERQRALGYEIIGAFDRGVLVGVLGMRPVETLARGAHLHVDDLVVDASQRGRGVGRALLEFCEADARARKLVAVFLDSRAEVVSFYARLGYGPHTAQLMRKRLSSP